MKRTRTVRALAAVLVTAGALTACSGTGEVTKDDLQNNMKSSMNEQNATDSPVKSVTCPNGLQPNVGDTVTCTATTESSEKIEVVAKVTSVDGDTVNYTMKPKQSGGVGA